MQTVKGQQKSQPLAEDGYSETSINILRILYTSNLSVSTLVTGGVDV